MRLVLLKIGDQEVQQERFPRTGAAENDGVRYVPMMQIQEVGRVVAGLKDGQVLLLQVMVHGVPAMEGKQERVVRVVGVGDAEPPEIEG